MWIIILYVCVQGSCQFIDSPPMYSQDDCKRSLAKAAEKLNANDAVVAFDGTCVKVKMREAAIPR